MRCANFGVGDRWDECGVVCGVFVGGVCVFECEADEFAAARDTVPLQIDVGFRLDLWGVRTDSRSGECS